MKIAFLSTFSGIWAHSSSESLLMQQLGRNGHQVTSIACDGILPGLCNVRASRKRSEHLLAENPNVDCFDCKFSASLSSAFSKSVTQTWLGKYLSSEDYKKVNILEQSWVKTGVDLDAIYFGHPLPTYAAYEVMLHSKKLKIETLVDASRELRDSLKSCLLVLLSAKKFFESHPEIDVVIARTPQYAVNRTFCEVALEYGKRVLYLDGSSNFAESYTHLSLKDLRTHGWSNPANKHFNSPQLDPSPTEWQRIAKHLDTLFAGRSHKVYSSAKKPLSKGEIRKIFGIAPGAKVVLAALSSTDEPLAANQAQLRGLDGYPGEVFDSQVDWIRWLVKWAEQNKEVHLVVRLHPREFPNKREASRAEMADVWEQELGHLPSNVSLNHPNQGLSIYNLFETTTVLTTAWSSVAIEGAMVGVPFVTYDSSLPWYPSEIGLTGSTIAQYKTNLELSLNMDSSMIQQQGMLAKRWLHASMNLSTYKVGGRLFASKREQMAPLMRKVLEGLERYFPIAYKPLDLAINRFLLAGVKLDERVLAVIDGQANSILEANISRKAN